MPFRPLVAILLIMRAPKLRYGQNYATYYRIRIHESGIVHDDEQSRTLYEFRADETTFYFVAFCVAFAMCMAHSDRTYRGKHILHRICVAISTGLVSCGIVSLVLAGCHSAGITIRSPWPGLGMAAILGSLKERVYTVGWDMLKWFWKGRINFVVDDKEKQQ